MDHGEDVAPESQTEQQPDGEAQQVRGAIFSSPPRGQHERPRPERQHLHVVPVVAEAVASDEGGREGGIQARGERRPAGRAGEQRQPIKSRDERRKEPHRDERERARGIDGHRQRRGQMRLQAPAVRHVGHEDEVLRPIAQVEGHDPRERAVGGHVTRGALPGEREPEEDRHADDEEQGPPRAARRRPPQLTPSPGQPETRENEHDHGEHESRDPLPPCRPPSRGDVEPPEAQQEPQRRGRGPRGPGPRGRTRAAQKLLPPTFMPRCPGVFLRATKIMSRL